MAKGNGIIVNAEPKGRFLEGIVVGTPKPGTVMHIDSSVAIGDDGRFSWKANTQDDDRPLGPIAVLLEDSLQGRLATTAYAEGERCFLYIQLPGDELNMLLDDTSGTGDDHTVGTLMIVQNTTGRLIDTTGTPEIEPFLLLEAITNPMADTLAWCMFTGY